MTLDDLCATSQVSLARLRTTCSPAGFLGSPRAPHLMGTHGSPRSFRAQPPRAQTPNIEVRKEKVQLSGPAFCRLKSAKASSSWGPTRWRPGAQAGGQRPQGWGRRGPGAVSAERFLPPARPHRALLSSFGGRTQTGEAVRTRLYAGCLWQASPAQSPRPPHRPQPGTCPSPALMRRRPGPRCTEEPCESFQHPFFFGSQGPFDFRILRPVSSAHAGHIPGQDHRN